MRFSPPSITMVALGTLALTGCGSSVKTITRTVSATTTRTQPTTSAPLEQGYLGAATVTIEPSLLEALPIPESDETRLPHSGVLIESVEPRSPAALAGLHGEEGSPYKDFGGDAITAADDMPINSNSELGGIVASLKPGQIIPLTVARSFEEQRSGTQGARFVYEEPTVVSVRLGVRPPAVPRVRSLGQDCGSTEAVAAKTGKPADSHLFATGPVPCAMAAHVVREYASRPANECRGSGCVITLPDGWTCTTSGPATEGATERVQTCRYGAESITTLKANPNTVGRGTQ